MKKVISILVLFICAFAIIACETPHEHKFVNGSCECGKIEEIKKKSLGKEH